MSSNEIATTVPAPSATRGFLSWLFGGPVTLTPPARPEQDDVALRPMTMVNLSSSVLRLVRIEGAVPADSLPPLGVLVRRGEQLPFSVAPAVDRDESVVAHFEVVDASGQRCDELYTTAISPFPAIGWGRPVTTPLGAPLTEVHLTQDHIVLRDAAA